jgi:hypothetical protein
MQADLSGQVFSRLTVIGRTAGILSGKTRRKAWLCRCECGKEKAVRDEALRTGDAKSCGCNRYEALVNDRTGQRYGTLTVVRQANKRTEYGVHWVARCDCGKEKTAAGPALAKLGSCGGFDCTARIIEARPSTRQGQPVSAYRKAGQSNHPLYGTWAGIKSRCLAPTATQYASYGGRGIRVCERWLGRDGFFNFVADVGERPEGTTLDRIDPNGNYDPGNVRWSTQREQMQNTRNARVRIEAVLESFSHRDPALIAEIRRALLGAT